MEQITGYIGDSSSWAIALTHPITGAAFEPGGTYGLVATFKNRENDSDANAVIQKATGAGITVSGSTATVTLVRADTEGFCECNLHFGIRATNASTGASFTVAERRVKFEKPTTLETTTSVDVVTTEDPLPFGGITSYVSEIETLPDYPSSFPTTPADISSVGHEKLIGRHGAGTGTAQEIGIDGGLELQGGNLRRAAVTGPVTIAAGGSVSAIADGALSISMTSGLQTILNGSTGGNGIADAGKLVKFGSSGQISLVGDTLNPALYGSNDDGDAVVAYSTVGNGVFANSVNGSGAEFISDYGVYHAKFGDSGNDRSAIERVRGWFVWFYSTFTGRIKTADITADREWTLPDASGTIALKSELDLKANLAGTNTFTGANIFSSTTRPTSAGTGTPASTSLMTRDDVTRDEFLGLGISFKNLAAPSFATSGTGTTATSAAGDRWVNLVSGTSNSGWARASIGRGLTTNSAASGSGINFSKRIGVSVVGFVGKLSFTDALNVFRIVVGSNQTPTAYGTDPVTYRSFGLEIRSSGTAHEIRAFGHNGTSITYSSWVDTGLPADTLSARVRLAVESDGAGNITAFIINNHSTRAEVTATCTGGPTTAGALAQSYVDIQVANSSSGTTALGAAFYDHLFYVI